MATLSQRNNLNALALAIITGLLTLTLAGCGGGSDNNKKLKEHGHSHEHNDGNGQSGGQNANAFTETATWTVNYNGAVQPICYDFDSKTEVADCQGKKWDIKFDNQGTDGVKFWTNGGISGDGKGAAFFLMPLESEKGHNLSMIKDATKVPLVGYRTDRGAGIFAQYPWAEYNINGQHKMSPNYRVYLITTDESNPNTTGTAINPVFAVQLIGYENKQDKSGFPTIRWIDMAMPQNVKTKMVDASTDGKWTYLNLKTGEIVDKNGDWQLGFNRYNVITNSGASGNGTVGGYLAKDAEGYYTENSRGQTIPVVKKFNDKNDKANLTKLTDTSAYKISQDSVPWVTDKASSQLNPKATGNYPVIDYGWYVYHGDKGHVLEAKPKDKAIGALIRSGEGDSYAKMTLDSIENGVWTFKFEVQPAN